MIKKLKNKQGGFLQLIILIIIILVVMSYFHISLRGVINWIVNLVSSVFH